MQSANERCLNAEGRDSNWKLLVKKQVDKESWVQLKIPKIFAEITQKSANEKLCFYCLNDF